MQAGNAMFSTGIQYVVARALLSQPQHYAGMSRHNESLDSQFKKKASVKEMAYLEKTSLVQNKPTPSKRSLLQELEALTGTDDEQQQQPAPKKKKVHKSSKNLL